MDRSQLLAAAGFAFGGENAASSPDGAGGEDRNAIIQRLHAQGLIDEEQETAMIRFFNDYEHMRREEVARAFDEYTRRAQRDGVDSARVWLQEAGHAMGEQDREVMAEMLARLRRT